MTKPTDSAGISQSNPPTLTPGGSSETVPAFEFNRGAAEKPSAAHPEKLFGLFAQALFSAPIDEALNSASPLPENIEPESTPLIVPRLKALVVGFTESELNPLCFLLSSLKFDTSIAATADQALEMLAVHPVALLMIDWDLPTLHVLQLAPAVRKMSIEQPLMIGLATQLTEALKRSADGTDLDHCYEKPLSHDLLIDCLRGKGFAVSEPSL